MLISIKNNLVLSLKFHLKLTQIYRKNDLKSKTDDSITILMLLHLSTLTSQLLLQIKEMKFGLTSQFFYIVSI